MALKTFFPCVKTVSWFTPILTLEICTNDILCSPHLTSESKRLAGTASTRLNRQHQPLEYINNTTSTPPEQHVDYVPHQLTYQSSRSRLHQLN